MTGLHELVSCVRAPTVAISGQDGQIRPGGWQGVLRSDRRVLSELVVDIDGREPMAVGHGLHRAGTARFVGLVSQLGDAGPDSTVRLERSRSVRSDGMDERLELVNVSQSTITAVVRLRMGVDLAGAIDMKHGTLPAPLRPSGLVWADEQTQVTLSCVPAPTVIDGGCEWRVAVPPRSTWVADLSLDVTDLTSVANTFAPAAQGLGWDEVVVEGPADLAPLVDRCVDDVAALALADPLAPEDVFVAGGSPWFFTLFGRDSLWAARLTLPLGTDLARGTLRTLARRQGSRHDSTTSEAPGKILHEVRSDVAGSGLPPVYYGSVDATALWVCLLHDAWRWGMAAEDVAAMLDPLQAALGWLMRDADSDGDGFLEYVDASGRGLANQGWKDSGDSIQSPEGAIAKPPIALCEVQAYAYQAALAGADVLDAFDHPGSEELRAWAAALRERFRAAFWVADDRGRFPAIALDGAKEPVATASSNPGHVLGTGLLDAADEAAVAARLSQPDLDSGYGLRTMSSDVAGFNPLGYHTGSIWSHDTAIAIRGLTASSHAHVGASLARGLLRAAPAFGHRLPELFGGMDAHAGAPVVAYPEACRPIAWSAGAAVSLLQSALGLSVDVPLGELRVVPHPEFSWLFPLRVSGLRVAGHPLSIEVDADGTARVETTAPLALRR